MINQISLVTAIIDEINRQHKEEHDGQECSAEPFQFNAVIAGANEIIRGWQRPRRSASTNIGIDIWLNSDDCGASSLAMAKHILGRGVGGDHHPHDADDFHRCMLFLSAVPEAKDPMKLERMRWVSPTWSKLYENWEALTALYEEEKPTGRCPKLNAEIQRLTNPTPESPT